MIAVLKEIIQLIRFQYRYAKFSFSTHMNLLNLHALSNVQAICVLNIFRALENQFEF